MTSYCWRIGRIALALVFVVACGYGLARTVLVSRMFSIGGIAVHGTTRLSPAEVDALLQGLRGQHILLVDLDRYARRLMDSPWVAGAALRRVLPGTIEVRIVERTPMAIARIHDRLYLVDADGVVMDEFGPEYREFDLPVVDGLVRVQAGQPAQVDPSRAALTHQFLQALQGAALRQRVSQVDVSNARDVVVLLDSDPTMVHLGDARFLERLRTYEELAPALQERLQEIDYVDMRFDERVYVKSKKTRALTNVVLN